MVSANNSGSKRDVYAEGECPVAFLTPANAMLTVELGYLADVLDAAGVASNVSEAAREYKANITEAIWNHTARP